MDGSMEHISIERNIFCTRRVYGGAVTAECDVTFTAPIQRAAVCDRAVAHDRYLVQGELARGGSGRILCARDRRTGCAVLIKEALHHGRTAEQRFLREMHLTARLAHPGIVPVLGFGSWPDGRPFFVIEHVHGASLKSRIRKATTRAARLALVRHLVDAAEAVAYAHAAGIIHRDLKPSNLLVDEHGRAVVIDWGLAKDLRELCPSVTDLVVDLRRAPVVVGTPAYMAPEQARGEPVGPLADVYALGATLFHVVSGTPPAMGSPREVIAERARNTPTLRACVPPQLRGLIERAMAHDPARRTPGAAALADELRSFVVLDDRLAARFRA
jgi:serine/threonine protein kinase